ncbi:uncharacterized protein LOC125178721 [Hyalella azteca]|uniref:Uncharacterized protein LOC125178721 n=1 Tax=Hyalella azteca TaxID=294128 RepID=A0A979FPT9_HYAAZ|nr:uncharacterized protein LOC125178721 [Hyalella azteca]
MEWRSADPVHINASVDLSEYSSSDDDELGPSSPIYCPPAAPLLTTPLHRTTNLLDEARRRRRLDQLEQLKREQLMHLDQLDEADDKLQPLLIAHTEHNPSFLTDILHISEDSSSLLSPSNPGSSSVGEVRSELASLDGGSGVDANLLAASGFDDSENEDSSSGNLSSIEEAPNEMLNKNEAQNLMQHLSSDTLQSDFPSNSDHNGCEEINLPNASASALHSGQLEKDFPSYCQESCQEPKLDGGSYSNLPQFPTPWEPHVDNGHHITNTGNSSSLNPDESLILLTERDSVRQTAILNEESSKNTHSGSHSSERQRRGEKICGFDSVSSHQEVNSSASGKKSLSSLPKVEPPSSAKNTSISLFELLFFV